MGLTLADKKQLFENGYIKLDGVVPKELVNEALRAINSTLGKGTPLEEITKYRAQSYCPEIQASSAITNLLHNPNVIDLVGSIIDLQKVVQIASGQIALRFPSNDTAPRKPSPHIDGMYTPDNGVKKGKIENFTALVGVLLSELPEEYAGNFTVWPKSHLQHEQYFREHGADALLEGMPPVPLAEPVQITGKPGDIVIAHYALAHSAAMNISPNIRYAIFFRLKHVDINESNWRQSMEHIWIHWSGMEEI